MVDLSAILEARLPCQGCGRMTAGQIYLALGNQGGTHARGLKSVQAELPTCELCAGGS